MEKNTTLVIDELLAKASEVYDRLLKQANTTEAFIKTIRKTSHWKNPNLYKTSICDHWRNKRKCKYGPKCWYAHGPAELRPASASSNSNSPPIYDDQLTTLGMSQVQPSQQHQSTTDINNWWYAQTAQQQQNSMQNSSSSNHSIEASFNGLGSQEMLVFPLPQQQSTCNLAQQQRHSNLSLNGLDTLEQQQETLRGNWWGTNNGYSNGLGQQQNQQSSAISMAHHLQSQQQQYNYPQSFLVGRFDALDLAQQSSSFSPPPVMPPPSLNQCTMEFGKSFRLFGDSYPLKKVADEYSS